MYIVTRVFGLAFVLLLATACGSPAPTAGDVSIAAQSEDAEYVEATPEPEPVALQFTQSVSSPKGYTGELTFDIALPTLRLGDPGMVVVATPTGTAEFTNTTPGGREVSFFGASGPGMVEMYWKLPPDLADAVPGLDAASCSDWTKRSKKKPYLVTKLGFAPDDPDGTLAAGTTPMNIMGENIMSVSQIADSRGIVCMNAPIAAFPESLQPDLEKLLQTLPSFVQVSQGGLRFADGMYGQCVTPGGFASAGQLIVNTFDPTVGPGSSIEDFGDCTRAEK